MNEMKAKLTEVKRKNLQELKSKIIERLRSTKRDGIENLLDFMMNKSDYFTAPASAKYHNNMTGGLADHSDNLVKLLLEKNERFNLGLSEASIYIVGYTHDLCKCNMYKKSMRLKKDAAGKWIGYSTYDYDEELPLGHGEKSLSILQDFIKVTVEEKMMIMYHMGLGLPKERYADLSNAIEKYPCIVAAHTADYEASRYFECTYEPELYTIDEYNSFMRGTLKI